MEETLDGDLVLLIRHLERLCLEESFLIYFYGEKMAVRLYRGQEGLINIVRDNQSYSDQESISESEIIVLGKLFTDKA